MARLIEEGAAERASSFRPEFAERFGTVINALGNGIRDREVRRPRRRPDDLFGWALSVIFRGAGASTQPAEAAAR